MAISDHLPGLEVTMVQSGEAIHEHFDNEVTETGNATSDTKMALLIDHSVSK